ncbi:immunity protein Imm33 domain-containing protein [Emticicia fontis]
MDYSRILQTQKEICQKWQADFFESPLDLKIGIAENIKSGVLPINGLRLSPEGDSSGWYIWAGEELSKDKDFFKPLHLQHLESWIPDIHRYLGLPPGWRFLIADGYEDIWFDEELLK